MPIDSEEINLLARIILEEYHPDSIILFGSQARGDAGPDSDIDLLVVSDREKHLPRPHRGRELRLRLAKTRKAYDILIYSKAELERYMKVPQSFAATVLREGVVLHGG